ncbi:MAG TPA: DUF4407 domain-containing protein [Chryseosolibacter sp.]|nr:DUF4407 domain-containing protein [Chryseosolibacter sp.]
MQKITSFFWFCSGADTNILKNCPTESSKYVGIGATVFFTGIFAWLAASYALYTVFDNIYAAAACGFLWGLMIFNLDRFIVSSMRKEHRFKREFYLALPRIILAILISIVIAKPLELKIFEKEIAPELVLMEQEKFTLQEKVIQSRFAGRGDSLKNEVGGLKSEIDAARAKRDALVAIAQQEADGTGGSKKRNPGPIYKIKKADADNAERELAGITSRNSEKINMLEEQASLNDKQMSTEIAQLEHAKMNGPAARIEALDRLASESDAIWWAHWFIMLLFIVIETAPVFVKLISPRGPYDHMLKIDEHNYFTREVEEVAKQNAATKERSGTLPETERSYINDKLNASLR